MISPVSIQDLVKIGNFSMPRKGPQQQKASTMELTLPSITFAHGSQGSTTQQTQLPTLKIPSPPLEPPAEKYCYCLVPAGYILLASAFALCNLISPMRIQQTAFLVCPMFTMVVALHFTCKTTSLHKILGVCLILGFPVVGMIGEGLISIGFMGALYLFLVDSIHHRGVYLIVLAGATLGFKATCAVAVTTGNYLLFGTIAGFNLLLVSQVCTRDLWFARYTLGTC